MRFFNQKEEVLDVQLTQHGKRLLSVGKLEPAYYAFYDKDILYDISYAASGSEKQKDSRGRILYDTPRLRTQYSFTTVESTADPHVDNTKRVLMQPVNERHYFADSCLGNASLTNEYVPAWEASLLKGEFESIQPALTASAPCVRIPQLSAEVKYKTLSLSPFVPHGADESSPEGGDTDFVDSRLSGQYEFEDGSRIVVEKDHILLNLEEINVDYKNENFDIEVYEIQLEPRPVEIVNGEVVIGPVREVLQQLYFKGDPMSVLGIGAIDEPQYDEFTETDPNCVEYFLDISVDREIPAEDLCKYTRSIRRRTFLDRGFDCPDEEGDEIRVDYGGVLEEPEECD